MVAGVCRIAADSSWPRRLRQYRLDDSFVGLS